MTTSSGNRLASDGTYDYAYDADGNLLTKTTVATGATTTYTWDYRNRLTDVTDRTAGGTVTGHVHYTYDVLDRRIGQQVDGNGDGTYDSTERYVYDGGGSLLLTLSGTGAITHAFLNGPAGSNQVLADDAGGSGVTWLLADRLGSVKDVINPAGTVVDHLQYDSYGNITAQSDAGNQPRFGYAGMQLDPATGLYYDNARYYDAGTGTFISQDPSGFAGGNANLYGYVNNDPTNLIDPLGLWSIAKLIYTGDGNASDEVYNAATNAAGQWLYSNSPVRGGYVSAGIAANENAGVGRDTGAATLTGQWTIEDGGGIDYHKNLSDGVVDFGPDVLVSRNGTSGALTIGLAGQGGSITVSTDGSGTLGFDLFSFKTNTGAKVAVGAGLILDWTQFANSDYWKDNEAAIKNIWNWSTQAASEAASGTTNKAAELWSWLKDEVSGKNESDSNGGNGLKDA